MITSRHFSEIEFNRCTPSCSLQDMDQEAMLRHDRVRDYAGIPLIMNCAYRSVAWDKSKGRSGNGAHPEGTAMDYRCNSNATRWKIINAAIKEGATRIGIAKTFIHVDFSKTLPKEVVWLY